MAGVTKLLLSRTIKTYAYHKAGQAMKLLPHVCNTHHLAMSGKLSSKTSSDIHRCNSATIASTLGMHAPQTACFCHSPVNTQGLRTFVVALVYNCNSLQGALDASTHHQQLQQAAQQHAVAHSKAGATVLLRRQHSTSQHGQHSTSQLNQHAAQGGCKWLSPGISSLLLAGHIKEPKTC